MSYLYLITCLLLHKKYGNTIHDIAQKYENVDLSQLRELKKISLKIGKAELDIRFRNNYRTLSRNSCFNLPGANLVRNLLEIYSKTPITECFKETGRRMTEVKNKL